MTRYYRTTRARSTGAAITTAHAADLGLDTTDPWCRWFNICDEHDETIGHATLALARSFAAAPEDWCEGCRAKVTP